MSMGIDCGLRVKDKFIIDLDRCLSLWMDCPLDLLSAVESGIGAS